MTSKVTPEMKQEMNRLRHEDGLSYSNIMDIMLAKYQVSISDTGIRWHTDPGVKEYDRKYRSKHSTASKRQRFGSHYSEEDKEHARILHKHGWSYRAIANVIGCTPPTVANWCNEDMAETTRKRTREYWNDPARRKRYTRTVSLYIKDRMLNDPKYRLDMQTRKRERSLLLARGGYELLIEKADSICGICGEPLPQDIYNGRLVHMDHIIPRGDKHRGSDHIDNLHLVHAHCNLVKGNRLIEEIDVEILAEHIRKYGDGNAKG